MARFPEIICVSLGAGEIAHGYRDSRTRKPDSRGRGPRLAGGESATRGGSGGQRSQRRFFFAQAERQNSGRSASIRPATASSLPWSRPKVKPFSPAA